jgi:hypothetical protein
VEAESFEFHGGIVVGMKNSSVMLAA